MRFFYLLKMIVLFKYYIWSSARINGILWDLENEVRDVKIKDKNFINASKKIFQLNQTRNQIKNDINVITGSDYLDVKEYETK